MKTSLLRLAPLALALGVAAVSQADVRYTLAEAGFLGNSFSLVTPTFVTSTTTFGAGQLQSSSVFLGSATSVVFTPSATTTTDHIDLNSLILGAYPGTSGYDFAKGSLGAYGTYVSTGGTSATLTVAPVPEPASVAALGLGALRVLRRRRRS